MGFLEDLLERARERVWVHDLIHLHPPISLKLVHKLLDLRDVARGPEDVFRRATTRKHTPNAILHRRQLQ